MCAIFGIIGRYSHKEALISFNTLAHRGEDDSNFIAKDGYFFGVHRLAITNVNVDKTQPYIHENLIVVFNGEIYNYQSICDELGCKCTTEEEAIARAYVKYGDDFVSIISGMYAIAIYDGKKLKLFRDKIGKKPLFYRSVEDSFWFASEPKALGERSSRYESINSYLSFQTTISPNTFFEDIYSLSAGEMLEYDGKEVVIKNIFHPLSSKTTIDSKAKACDTIKAKLINAVDIRISSVPYGVLLSGGLDSSLVASILSQKQKIDTYCVGYEDKYGKYDERSYARTVSGHINSNHTEVIFTKEKFYKNLNIVDMYFESPIGDPAILPLLSVFEQIKSDGKKVVITGDGSDELFLGYKTYKEFYDIEKLKEFKRPNWLLNQLKGSYSANKEWEWHKRALEGSLLFRSTAEIFTDLQQNRLLKRNVKDNTSQATIQKYRDEFISSGRESELDWYSFCDMKIKLGNLFLVKLDRASMIYGLEARSPFLDEKVVECAFSILPETKFGNRSKAIIKDIASEYLPSEIIERKKRGFSYPYIEWLIEENELELIRKVNSEHKIFVDDEVDFLLSKANSGGFKHQLFTLYMYCRWLDIR